MSLEENRYNSPYEELKRERTKFNIIGIKDPRYDNFSGSPKGSSCPVDHTVYIQRKIPDGIELFCPTCGQSKKLTEQKIEQDQSRLKLKTKGLNNNTPFIVSQGQKKRSDKPDFIKDIENATGGFVTSWTDTEL